MGSRINNKTSSVLLKIGLFGALVSIYYFSSSYLARANDNLMKYDQINYINAVIKTYDSNYWYLGDRVRMPGYHYLQVLFLRPGMTVEEMFTIGKQVNIILSFFLLVGLYFIVKQYFATREALLFTLLTAGLVFIFGAGYFRVELIYYFFLFTSFLCMYKSISSRELKYFFMAALLSTISYLLKASMLLTMYIFLLMILILISKLVLESKYLLKDAKSKVGSRYSPLIKGVGVFAITFLLLSSPYLIENKKTYGSYFYNIATNSYIWYDDPGQYSKVLGEEGESGIDWLKVNKEEFPSASTYFGSHSVREIITRFYTGAIFLTSIGSWSYYTYFVAIIVAYYILAAFVVALALSKKSFKKYLTKIEAKHLFVVLFILINFLAILWYSRLEITDRFIMALFLPLLFCLFYILNIAQGRWMIRIFNKKLDVTSLLHLFPLILVSLIFVTTFFTWIFI